MSILYLDSIRGSPTRTGSCRINLDESALSASIRSSNNSDYYYYSSRANNNDNNNNNNGGSGGSRRHQHLYVLPVLLLEFLAISLTRAVLPLLLLQHYDNQVYLVMGFAECIRGLLAFVSCPMFGKISDVIGRRLCLLVTVIGTCAPVCSLALFSWEHGYIYNYYHNNFYNNSNLTTPIIDGEDMVAVTEDAATSNSGIWSFIADAFSTTTTSQQQQQQQEGPVLSHAAITTFIVLLSISGLFTSTFTLVFAYISDTVQQQEERVAAYGLALATFGLSFTIGPMAGGYLAQYNAHYVFLSSFLFTVLDVLYIYFILPESQDLNSANDNHNKSSSSMSTAIQRTISDQNNDDNNKNNIIIWNPLDALRIITMDPFLKRVGEISFLYYTGFWAVVSTLSVYAVKQFNLSPERLGELMSALGLCTMIAEAVLVRIIVPIFGEKRSIQMGLLSFMMQCLVLGFAYNTWHLFVCVLFSMFGNLVYPSLSSLVSANVEPTEVGEALGAINGIKALTEGIGPLIFGSLMTISGKSKLPGWPYLLAAMFVYGAYTLASHLPNNDDNSTDIHGGGTGTDDYVHELERKRIIQQQQQIQRLRSSTGSSSCAGGMIAMQQFVLPPSAAAYDEEEEYEGLLLSEVEESESDSNGDVQQQQQQAKSHTFASLFDSFRK